MKIRWSFLFFGSFGPHFQIKLSTHGSNLNPIFVIMSELKFFLLMGVLTQNFNTNTISVKSACVMWKVLMVQSCDIDILEELAIANLPQTQNPLFFSWRDWRL
jgi:hypothetical protein